MADLAELNEAESRWIAELVEGLHQQGVADTAHSLSEYFAAQRAVWFATAEQARVDPNPVINAIGAALGDVLVRDLGLRWVIASDEYGTEAAVYGSPGDILLYPMNVVAKRWTGEADGTIEEFIASVTATIRDLQVRGPGSE